jgi:hypothetical protein
MTVSAKPLTEDIQANVLITNSRRPIEISLASHFAKRLRLGMSLGLPEETLYSQATIVAKNYNLPQAEQTLQHLKDQWPQFAGRNLSHRQEPTNSHRIGLSHSRLLTQKRRFSI